MLKKGLDRRLAYVWRRAVPVIGLTSCTVVVAVCAASGFGISLSHIRDFGFFTALAIVVNTFLVTLLFPAVVCRTLNYELKNSFPRDEPPINWCIRATSKFIRFISAQSSPKGNIIIIMASLGWTLASCILVSKI